MDKSIEKFDVCIIGGSLAGNYLCHLISKFGLTTAVIEEHEQIGLPLQCAGIVSKKIEKLIELPNKLILNRVKAAKLVSPSQRSIILSGDEEPLIIDRIGLDQHFYNLTHSLSNVKFLLGEKFLNFSYIRRKTQVKLCILTSKRKIEAQMLIGCDGPLSSVGKSLKLINNVIYASQIRIKGTYDLDKAVMYFDPRWKELFGWIVPEGNDIYRIGLATSRSISNKFRNFLGLLHLDIKNKISQQGGIIPYGLMRNLTFDNGFLLGDAACQVKATTGGGIIMLLTAAKIAALAIRAAFKSREFSSNYLKRKYEKPCNRIIGKELKIHYIIRLILEEFKAAEYDTFFNILKTYHIEKIVSLYGDMDFPKQLIMQLMKDPLVLEFFLKFFIHRVRLLRKILLIMLKY
ncbi:MAG: hypothetical protein ACFFKA_01430 [Candidatus Thorarchaeota archaeon]